LERSCTLYRTISTDPPGQYSGPVVKQVYTTATTFQIFPNAPKTYNLRNQTAPLKHFAW